MRTVLRHCNSVSNTLNHRHRHHHQRLRQTAIARTASPRSFVLRSSHAPPPSSASDTCSRPVMPTSSAAGHDAQTSIDTAPSTAHDRMSNGDISQHHAGSVPTGNLAAVCNEVNRRVQEFLARKPKNGRVEQVQRMTRESLGVIEEALDRYSLEKLSFSYNGGKDCLVLLLLYLSALHTHSVRTHTTLPPTLRSVYIVSPNPFPSVTSFVESSALEYQLSLARYAKPMREAFASYLNDYPSVQAIFVGTRRTDPHGGSLTHFDETDGGWPRFMRIHPVIDWQYVDIWGFIRDLEVEYCELYDLGYTSLGGTDDTHPNPALEIRGEGGDGEKKVYRPAHELVADEEERLGRDR